MILTGRVSATLAARYCLHLSLRMGMVVCMASEVGAGMFVFVRYIACVYVEVMMVALVD